MPIKGIDHIDLAVRDVERSLAFYLGVFGPLGVEEAFRYPTYRGTEEVIYLRFGKQVLGLRQADGGEFRYYDVGLEHLGFAVSGARVGKVVDLEIDATDPAEARAQVEKMCEQLLANPLMESYEVEIHG